MSTTSRILVLDPTSEILTRHSGLLKDADAGVVAETVATISEALARLSRAGYDAVVCRVEGPAEISFLIRIRNAAPQVPLVAVTPQGNAALDDLARESGADEIQPDTGEKARKTIVRIRQLIRGVREIVGRSRELRARNRELIAEHRRIVTRNRLFARQRLETVAQSLERFFPLLVEDSADQAFLMKRAFAKTSLPCKLPVMKNGKEAIEYLAGEGLFADRDRYPLPTLVILDVRMPMRSGLEVLAWIRSRPEFAFLPVYMRTSSTLEFDRAMELGSTDYFTKPMSFDGLTDIIRNIAVRWWFFEQARAFQDRFPKA